MSSQFALDLRLARKKAGFSQGDLTHLLDKSQAAVSRLENGACRPNLTEIIDLSLIYGRSFEGFFAEVMAERKKHLLERLTTLPAPVRETLGAFNRPASLERLKRQLSEATAYGSA